MFEQLSDKVTHAFKHLQGKTRISEKNIEETLAEVRRAFLEADVNFKVVKEFIAGVKDRAIGEKVIDGVDPGQQFVKIMHDELTKVMGEENIPLDFNRPDPLPILIVGLNGAGKTTFCGKLALYLRKKEKKESLLVPADTMRPAAKEQLLTNAKNISADYFDSDLGMHPKDIALKAYEKAKEEKKDVVIIDTAGRLQVDKDLMEQIREVREAIAPLNPQIFLVADAMTGQEAVGVAQAFHETVGLTGVVLSKMDSDARGGAALSIRHASSIPIRFFSNGEKMSDLEAFHPERLAGRILDMGDVLTLVEKAEEVIDEKEAEKMMKKMEKNKFSIDDFLKQMDSMNKLGSMESLMKMIPGMGGAMKQMGDLSVAEGEMKKMRVIISSMTKKERDDDKLLNTTSRKARIAKGSGTTLKDVNDFLAKFRQMRKMMSSMMGMMKGGMMDGLGNMFGGGMPGMPSMGEDGALQAGQRQQKQKKKGKGKRNRGGFGKWRF